MQHRKYIVTYEAGCIASNSSRSITRPVYSATGWFIRRFSAASIVYHTKDLLSHQQQKALRQLMQSEEILTYLRKYEFIYTKE